MSNLKLAEWRGRRRQSNRWIEEDNISDNGVTGPGLQVAVKGGSLQGNLAPVTQCGYIIFRQAAIEGSPAHP